MGVFSERRPDLPDTEIETLIKLYCGAVTPHSLPEVFAGDEFARPGD